MLAPRNRPKKKSPVEDRTFERTAGEGLREEFDDVFTEALYYFGCGLILVFMAGWTAFAVYALKSSVWFVLVTQTLFGIVGMCLGLWKLFRRGFALKRGLEGERAVGDQLKRLEKCGYKVIHDVPTGRPRGENIDHVVIGKAGVFALETKWMAKAGDHRLEYDGQHVARGGRPLKHDPLPQARAVAKGTSDILANETGERYFVVPVVLYPGWYVNTLPLRYDGSVNVMSDKYFMGVLENSREERLTGSQVAAAYTALKRHAEGVRRHSKN